MTQRHEPIFNVPPVVIATVAVLLLVHALRMWVFTEAQDTQFLLTFAFIPARYDAGLAGSFPGGFGADLWTFFSYTFIHANLLHIGLNLAWLLPFGTALARRFGAVRYTAFMLVTSAAGALAYLVSNPEQMAPMIGASAAISGAMAAAMRFVFQQGGLLGLSGDADAHRVPARPLLATLTDIRFLMFLVVWLGLNMLFGLGTVSIGGEEGEAIAWQAHIGGFFAGLDPVQRFRSGCSAGGHSNRPSRATPNRATPNRAVSVVCSCRAAPRAVRCNTCICDVVGTRHRCKTLKLSTFTVPTRRSERCAVKHREAMMTVSIILAGKGREVVTIEPNATLAAAVALLAEKRIGALLILGADRRIVGILSERDIVRALAERGAAALDEPVSGAMTRKVSTCHERETVSSIMERMTAGKFRHVPVVDQGRLTGMVSIGDVVKHRLGEMERDSAAMRDYILTA